MKTKFVVVLIAVLSLGTFSVSGAPANTAVLDGRPYEYDATDLRGTNTQPSHYGINDVITNLYVTWDATYLYVMLQGYENDNKLAMLMDVDPGDGTGATTTTNWTGHAEGYIGFNDPGWVTDGVTDFGLDYMWSSEGEFNNIHRVLYDGVMAPDTTNVVNLFDHGNGNAPNGGETDMVMQSDTTLCTLKGFESRIPWTNVYNSARFGTVGAGVVPTGATLRVFALLHNNSNTSAFSSSNAIPHQAASGSWSNGILTTDAYIDIAVDGDSNGVPDVASGDANGPFINNATGADGKSTAFVSFNEAATPGTAGTAANYTVDGFTPSSVTNVSPTLVQLDLASALPAEGTLVMVQSTGIEDATGNSKTNDYCLIVGAAGIDSSVTVTFVLNTNSGFAVSHGASGFHLNSDTLPLDEGFPPSTNTPLSALSGDLYSVDVTFPAGTPSQVGYRYSGILSGTNNYEAIRLDNFAFQRRWLELNTNGTAMVVTDYLGAAASPLRTGDTGYDALYGDTRRGDAGVKTRTTVLFQLDLSARNLAGITRVLMQGTDPLRGFNADAGGVADWAGGAGVGWDVGGLEMYDDGTHGDLTMTDRVFSVEWAWTTNGVDSTAEPDSPNSLVGGAFATSPYGGLGWTDDGSPRSFSYKFYMVDADTNSFESPSSNIEYYIHDADGTNIQVDAFVWDNDSIPKLSATNPAVIVEIIQSGSDSLVVYTNVAIATDNAIEMADEATETWSAYDLEGQGSSGIYTATVAGVTNDTQMYRVVTPSHARTGTWWEPHPAASGAVVTIYYNQNTTSLAGNRDVKFSSNVNGWSPDATSMTFISNGLWTVNAVASPETGAYGARAGMYWKANPGWLGQENGSDFCIIMPNQGISWTPNKPLPGDVCTITYDATGGPLDGQAQVNIHWWVDDLDGLPGGSGGTSWPGDNMTSNAPNSWVYDLTVPSNALYTVNFLFNEGVGSIKDENFSGGRNFNLFVGP